MGSWKNFLDVFIKADEDFFPENFYRKFLAPLKKNLTTRPVTEAFSYARKLIDCMYTQRFEELDTRKEYYCTPIDFLDLMVTYRNNFIGHGTQSMSKYKTMFTPLLKKGIIDLCEILRRIWFAFPIYEAKSASQAGGKYFILKPLLDDDSVTEIHSTDSEIEPEKLYILVDRKAKKVSSLFPIALWHKDDILFLNGSQDFRDIKYLGFLNSEPLKTEVHEDAFCDYILPFMNVPKLNSNDLADARAIAQALAMKDSGWSFPSLKKNDVIGPKDNQYMLIKPLGRGGMAEIWKGRV